MTEVARGSWKELGIHRAKTPDLITSEGQRARSADTWELRPPLIEINPRNERVDSYAPPLVCRANCSIRAWDLHRANRE